MPVPVALPLLLCSSIAAAGSLAQGRQDEAENQARASCEAAASSAPGPDSPLVFRGACEALARALVADGRVANGEATNAARAALEAARVTQPAAVPHVLALLARALVDEARYPEASAVLDEALPLLRAAPTANPQQLAEALRTLADLRIQQSDPAAALVAAQEARDVLAATTREPAEEARLLDTIAYAQQFQGRWDLADTALLAAERQRADAGLALHPDAAVTELLRGDAGWTKGDMTAAGEHYSRALVLADGGLRPGHPLRTRALGRLASWEAEMGFLERAIPRHREASELARINLGPTHPRLADYLNDFANALALSGEPEAAVAPLQEAVAVMEHVYGTASIFVATPTYNLANAYADAGQWQTALPHAARAATLWAAAFGDDDGRTRQGYKSWADILAGAGNDAAAVQLYRQALHSHMRAGEQARPGTARLTARLALALERLGRTQEAAALAAQAEHVLRDLIGWRDQEFAGLLALRARLALRRDGDLGAALRSANEADHLRERHVRSTVRFLGERLALRYLGERFEGRDLQLGLLAGGRRDARLARSAFDLVVRQRNLVLDELVRRSRAPLARATGEPHDPAWTRLTSARRTLSRLLYMAGPPQRETLRAAGRELEEAEREAAWGRAGNRLSNAPAEAFPERLATSLPPDSALVSFAIFGGEPRTGERRALAFVLRARDPTPRVVSLGQVVALDGLIQQWRDALAQADVYGDVAHERAERRLGRAVARALWEPLRPHLGNPERVFLVPDGGLHLVNFAALVDRHDRFLVEHGPTLHLLSSERQLLAVHDRQRPRSALIAAGPDFDVSAPREAAAPTEPTGSVRRLAAGALAWRGRSSSCSELGSLGFEPLPAARREGSDLRDVLAAAHVEATLLSDAAASEAALKAALGMHELVHIASHGFALDSACAASPREDDRGPELSPLLFSGLALAGANRRRLAAVDEEDGILTAEEIAGLHMREGSWVVLSGCETATGSVRAAEGVMGLRRAFAMAGASTVVMSLWRVQDDYARLWMNALYRARFLRGLDTAEAVRAASRDVLARLRATGKSTTPARWGAFVAAGDWR